LRTPRNVPVLSVAAAPVLREASLPYGQTPESDDNSGLSLSQIFAILWAYRMHAAVIAATILVCSAIFAKMLPKTYTATATLMVNYEGSNDPLAGAQAPIVPVYNYMSTEVQLMQSAEVLLPVIERLKLTENKGYAAGYKGDGYSLADWVKEKLVKDLDIEAGRAGSQLIYVTASARNRELAAQIANTLVEIYLDQERQRLSGPASDRAKRYAAELAELKHKVNLAQDQVTAFRQRTGVTDAGAQNNGEAALLASLETRLQEAQNARRAAEVKADADQKNGSGATASQAIQSLRSQINTERAQLAQLRATMGVAHPKVVELQNQMDANQRILDSEFNNVSAGAASDLSAARQLEAKLQAAVQEQRSKVLSISRLEDEGTKYVLELESAQSVYKRALDGYDQIMFASGGHATNINFVSRAVPPQLASRPNKFKLLFMGLVAGIALGVLGPLAYELLVNRRIRCRDDFERGFSIPVLMEFDAIPARSAA
jgi:succinoglycan biosynthesis transport protein ExoP